VSGRPRHALCSARAPNSVCSSDADDRLSIGEAMAKAGAAMEEQRVIPACFTALPPAKPAASSSKTKKNIVPRKTVGSDHLEGRTLTAAPAQAFRPDEMLDR
jgi:hypothetical protein